MLSWLDLMALVAFSAALALGIRQGAPFTLAFAPALLLYALLAPLAPALAMPLMAGALGLAMAYLAQWVPLPPLQPALEGLIGGLGGLLWGLLLASAIWVSFPSEFVASTGALRYPSEQLPLGVREGIVNSPFARPLFDWAAGHPTLRAALLPHLNHP